MSNPFGDQQNPYSAPAGGGMPMGNPAIEKEIASQATTSLVVGIISIFCCGIILGWFAIYRGNKALQLIAQYNVGHQHKTNATAGKIIGIIAIVLNVLGILLQLVMIGMQASLQQ
jgi:Sec-independent protein secretion pathway component TatC